MVCPYVCVCTQPYLTDFGYMMYIHCNIHAFIYNFMLQALVQQSGMLKPYRL